MSNYAKCQGCPEYYEVKDYNDPKYGPNCKTYPKCHKGVCEECTYIEHFKSDNQREPCLRCRKNTRLKDYWKR